jgi:hypothetical protein
MVYTMPEFLERRFNAKAEAVIVHHSIAFVM